MSAKLLKVKYEDSLTLRAYDIEVEDNHNYFVDGILVHNCKNGASQQGKAMMSIQTKSKIAMTGTPIMNNPLDVHSSLYWLGIEQHSFYQFKKHYCVMGGFGGGEVMGYKNLEQLRALLDTHMLRRLKKDVLDLPEKVHSVEYVEMNKKQTKVYNEVLSQIKDEIDLIRISPDPLARLIRLRQATSWTGILSSTITESAKLDRAEELIQDAIDNNDKVVLFSNWTAVTNPAYDRFKKYNPAMITGEIKDRQGEKLRFMTDPNCKLIIGTIGAMGTGYTLTAATTVIFLDEPWNRALKDQAEDRAHRIGTTGTVNVITLVTKDTIDERINSLVNEKGAMADLLVDGKVTNQHRGALLDYLIS
jgi:SNF2 family DNA or RNA helicase